MAQDFPGKGAKPGWYNVEGAGKRYYHGGDQFTHGDPHGRIPAENLLQRTMEKLGLGTSKAAGNTVSDMTSGTPTQQKGKPGSPPAPVSGTTTTGMGNLPPDYKKTEQKAGETADKHRPGAGFSSIKPADSTRTNSNGVVQVEHGSGITARSISEINSDLGIDLKEGFSSVALPNTKDGDVQLNQGSPLNVADSGYTQQEVDVLNSGGSREWNSDMSADDPGTLLTADGTDVKNTEWGKRGLTEERWKQRRAFLDAEDSLSGLRAMEAQKGIVYAGQKNYIRDGDKMHEISADDKKTVMRGGDGAQDFLNNYKSKLTQSTTPETPAESQAPTVVKDKNGAGNGKKGDKPAVTEFDIANK